MMLRKAPSCRGDSPPGPPSFTFRTPLVPTIHANSQPGFARPGGSLPPDPPRAGPPSSPPRPISKHVIADCDTSAKQIFLKFDTRPRCTSLGPMSEKKRGVPELLFALHRETCAARRRVRYIDVQTCFGRNCPLFFLKLGEKKHPPSSFSLFFFPKIHTLMYGTITQYTYVRTRAGC